MRTFAIFLSLLLPPFLPAAAEILNQIKNPDTFVYAETGDVDSLDPAYAYDTASHLVIFQVYEPLIMYKGSSVNEFTPLLAENVPTKQNGQVSADGKTYTFTIKKGIKFHDGSPLTPQDVKYSMMRFMLQDRAAGPASLLLEPIIGLDTTRASDGKPKVDFKELDRRIEVKGQDVIIRLHQPYAPFITIMAQWSYTLSKSWCAKNGDWDGREETWVKHNNPRKESLYASEKMNGTGPFMLERWDKSNKQTTLVRNDAYWRTPAALKRVVIKKIDEMSTRKLILDKGDADAIYVSLQHHPQVAEMAGVKTVWVEQIDSWNLVFNWKINPTANRYIGSGKLDGKGIPPDFFTDKDVRLGFAYAYDRATHIKEIARGKAQPLHSFIAPQLLGYNPDQPITEFDLVNAAEHFKKAWEGKLWVNGFKMVYIYNAGSDPAMAVANMIKRNLASVNPKFQVDVRPLEWSTLLGDERQKKIPFRYLGWLADYPDPHNFAHPYAHSRGAYASRYGYSNPAVDALIEKAIAQTDANKRASMYHEVTRLVTDDTAYIYGPSSKRPIVLRDWVQGFVPNPIFPDYFYFYWLSKKL